MKSILASVPRAAAVASALLLVSITASGKNTAPADSATRLLATSGVVPVEAAWPYCANTLTTTPVLVGSSRSRVSLTLGRPSEVLADGTWLYRNYSVNESAASGSLVVRFEHGRVAELLLVSPKVETSMLKAPAIAREKTNIVSK